MKLKTVKIVVESFETMNHRWKKGLRGKIKSKQNEEIISVASWEILGRLFSSPRLQILAMIPQLKPRSIAQLAKKMKKDFKNVYLDVKFLADLGLIELKEEGAQKRLVPIAKFNEIEFPLAA
jgi:predicted transcriptional regulator